MSPVRLEPFTAEHVSGAAECLAARHAAHRAVEPLLPERSTDELVAIISALLDEGSGVAAVEDGQVVGYMLGKEEADHLGRALCIEPAGCALAAFAAPELVRDLYAAAASSWVAAGLTRQNVFVPFGGELVDPLFRLSFGASAVQAIMEVPALSSQLFAAELRVRPGVPSDLQAAAELERQLDEHLFASPSFNGREPGTFEQLEQEWAGTWENTDFTHFVVERDGLVVGQAVMYRRPPDLRVGERNIDIGIAVTAPEARGTGAGVALTNYLGAWAAGEGYRTITTDWRMSNLSASRFWPARGFRPAFLRMYRSIP